MKMMPVMNETADSTTTRFAQWLIWKNCIHWTGNTEHMMPLCFPVCLI